MVDERAAAQRENVALAAVKALEHARELAADAAIAGRLLGLLVLLHDEVVGLMVASAGYALHQAAVSAERRRVIDEKAAAKEARRLHMVQIMETKFAAAQSTAEARLVHDVAAAAERAEADAAQAERRRRCDRAAVEACALTPLMVPPSPCACTKQQGLQRRSRQAQLAAKRAQRDAARATERQEAVSLAAQAAALRAAEARALARAWLPQPVFWSCSEPYDDGVGCVPGNNSTRKASEPATAGGFPAAPD